GEPSITHRRGARSCRSSSRRIRHPYLWRLESSGETRVGSVYYSMPMYGGDSLDLILADLERGFTRKPSLSPLSVGSGGEVHPQFHMHALELVFGAAEGLGRAHREGIAHRRLSPKNILLTPAGHLVITDFGGHPATEG